MDITLSEEVSVNDTIRLKHLAQLAEEQAARHDGDFVECGVFKGGTALILAQALKASSSHHRVHLFDAWQGMPSLREEDAGTSIPEKFFSDSSEKEVKRLLKHCGLHAYTKIHKGWFTDTLSEVTGPFSLVHIDCDLYAPVSECLSYFLPRMSSTGVLVIDDYGEPEERNFPGVQKAVDKCIEGTDWVVVPLGGKRDQSVKLVQKS
jgi:O-methyltransferase